MMQREANNAIEIIATNSHWPILSGLTSATIGANIVEALAKMLQMPNEEATIV